MPTYEMTVQRFEEDEFDEENECPIPGSVVGYTVFSTIQIGGHTFVRAVVESKAGRAARSNARQWFVEWRAANASCRMTPKMTRDEALREGERFAEIIKGRTFASADESLAFFRQHLPPVG